MKRVFLGFLNKNKENVLEKEKAFQVHFLRKEKKAAPVFAFPRAKHDRKNREKINSFLRRK